MQREIRAAVAMTAKEDNEKMIIEGKAIAFDSPTVLHTDERGQEYLEKIAPTALDQCITEDCCLKYNHKDEAPILARTRGGSLLLDKRPDGLYFRAELFDTQFSRDCYALVGADALQCSFAFTVDSDGEEYDKSMRMRTITKISRLWDLSIVSVPAYKDTFVKQARAYCEPKVIEDRAAQELAELRALVKSYQPVLHEEVDSGFIVGPDGYDKESDLDTLEHRMAEIKNESAGECDAKKLIQETNEVLNLIDRAKERIEKRKRVRAEVAAGAGTPIPLYGGNDLREKRKEKSMENIEIRAFQKYVADGSYKNLTQEERASLVTGHAGAVMPTEIYNKMIRNEQYSDLLTKATVIGLEGAGLVKIPLADVNSATWKQEAVALDPVNPAMNSIDLGGKELMRAIQYSASVEKMSVSEFTNWMANICAAEVTETLERAFIKGDGEETPHPGLESLEWSADANAVVATGSITAADVAKGLSMLPQKYARGAILLMNANTAYNTVGLFKGTSEYAYSLADGASKFMNKAIHISEYCEDNEIYIVDPSQLYVRFAMQPHVEVDRSVGFLSATSTIRCLTIVDYAWNTAACVKVSL